MIELKNSEYPLVESFLPRIISALSNFYLVNMKKTKEGLFCL